METEFTFSHIVNIPSQHIQYATAKDRRNRTHVFLLVTEVDGPVYRRNGLCGTWDLLNDGQQRSIRNLLHLAGSRIARYSCDSIYANN